MTTAHPGFQVAHSSEPWITIPGAVTPRVMTLVWKIESGKDAPGGTELEVQTESAGKAGTQATGPACCDRRFAGESPPWSLELHFAGEETEPWEMKRLAPLGSRELCVGEEELNSINYEVQVLSHCGSAKGFWEGCSGVGSTGTMGWVDGEGEGR